MKFISPSFCQHQKKALVRCGAIAAVALLFGCSPQSQTISCQPPQSSPELAEKLKQTPSLQLSVLLDGTLSMQGFVNSQPDSRYRQTLRLIDSASSTGWDNTLQVQNIIASGQKSSLSIGKPFLKPSFQCFIRAAVTLAPAKLMQR